MQQFVILYIHQEERKILLEEEKLSSYFSFRFRTETIIAPHLITILQASIMIHSLD